MTTETTERATDQVLAEIREYVMTKEQHRKLGDRIKSLQKQLMSALELGGEPVGDEGQNRQFPLDPPVRGIAALVRQRRVSDTVDETAAEAIARQKDLYDRLFKPVMELDQEAVLVAVQEGLIDDSELERIFPKKVTYALVMEKKR